MNARSIAALLGFCLIVAAGCGGDDPVEPPPAADVDEFMAMLPSWATFSPPRPDANEPLGDPQETRESQDGTDYDCTTTEYSITDTPEDIVVFSPDAEILWPGSLLQGDGFAGGLGSLQELPVRQRAPLTVFIDLLTENVSRTVGDPDASSVAVAVGALIQDATQAGHVAGSSIYFDQKRTHSLEQATLELGLSANYLGTRVTSELSYEQAMEQNTLTAYFVQEMFTVSMVLPQTPSQVFSRAFTQEILQDQVDRGRMGPDNPPTYISSIVYGRMFMLTMTSSYSFQEMESALQASRRSIAEGSIDIEHRQVLEESQLRVSTVGGVDDGVENLIQTGRLGDYFDAEAPLTSARPLSYTVRNLADNTIARVSETTEYSIRECSAVPDEPTGTRYALTLDKLELIERGCDGVFHPNPEVYYSFVLHTDGGNVNLSGRSAANAVVMEVGGIVNLNTPARNVDLYADGRGSMRITGTAWDEDSNSTDEIIGTWNLPYSHGISNGQRYYTRGGGGCRIRLYLSINKVADLYD